MSHSFHVENVPDAGFAETIAALAYTDIQVDCDVPESGWPQVAHVYREGVSIRAIETSLEKSTLEVRTMSCSSLDDFALAAAITEAVATKYSRPIQTEEGPVTVEQWRQSHGAAWQQEMCNAYFGMFVGMYREKRAILQLSGTRATLEAGPRMMEPLLKDPSTLQEKFFAVFRRLNYLNKEDVLGPSVTGTTLADNGKQARFSVLGPGVVTALSTEADFVVLTDAEQLDMITAFEDFVDAAAASLTWLGDGVALTPGIEGKAWQALVDALKPRALESFAARTAYSTNRSPRPRPPVPREEAATASATRIGE
jgi:hypothetical protein